MGDPNESDSVRTTDHFSQETLHPPRTLTFVQEHSAPLAPPLGELNATSDLPAAADYLLFLCGPLACAAPLLTLREVLPALPQPVPLPFSPAWFYGIFPLRTQMIGLADPVPLLLGELAPARHSDAQGTQPLPSLQTHHSHPTTAIVVGSGEHTLALAAHAVGDLVSLRDEDIQRAEELSTGTLRPYDRYFHGAFCPVGSQEPYFILDVDTLLADMLDAIEGEETRAWTT